MIEIKPKLHLGIIDNDNLRIDFAIPEDATIESLVKEMEPRKVFYTVKCLYDDDEYMDEVMEAYNSIRLRREYNDLKGYTVTDAWVEFRPDRVGYTVYLRTTEEDLSQRTFIEVLMEDSDSFGVAVLTMLTFVLVGVILMTGLTGLILVGTVILIVCGLAFLGKYFAKKAKYKRFVKIYARARREDR